MFKSYHDVKMAELQKTKMLNAKLLSIEGSSHSDSGHRQLGGASSLREN